MLWKRLVTTISSAPVWRRDRKVAGEVLSRGGRYQKVANNLEVKNVVVLDDETLEERRYVNSEH